MYNKLNNDVIKLIINNLSMKDLIMLRITNKENVEIVKYYDNHDMTKIKRYLKYWKKSFPNMISADIGSIKKFGDNDFQYLDTVQILNMNLCDQKSITNNAFRYLLKIKDLNLQGCCGHWIGGHHFTDRIFDHLINLEKFYIDNNHVITDNGIKKLTKMKDLTIHNCSNITNNGLYNLTSLIKLDIYNLHEIDDELFKNLYNLQELKMTFIHNVTDKGILQLSNIQKLNILSCNGIRFKDYDKLPKLYHIDLCHMNLMDNDLIFFRNIKSLSLFSCKINGSGFQYLKSIENLSIYRSETLVDEYFDYLLEFENIKFLNVFDCLTISNNKIKELESKFGNNFKYRLPIYYFSI